MSENVDRLLAEGIDLERRRLVLMGEVSERLLQRTIIGLEALEHQSHEPLTVIFSSDGGDFHAGLAIYDRIRLSPCKIVIEAFGSIKSMATIILQAADVRLIAPNVRFMTHRGSVEFSGNNKDVWKEMHFDHFFDEPLTERILLDKIRAKNKRFTKKQLDELLDTDTYFLPERVIELNLADAFIGGGKKK